jgi:3-deoxy-D-manno-octulosonic-acid transferase
MIALYRLAWVVLSPIWLAWLVYRIFQDKENWRRLPERFGFFSRLAKIVSLGLDPRVGGIHSHKALGSSPRETIWLHGASIGESRIALSLIGELSKRYPNHYFLITTGTITSAKFIENNLPERAIHQFIPLDEYFSVKRFFESWKPKIGIIIESEIWPNLLDIGSRYCKLILVNAIMSGKSYNRWMDYKNMALFCFSRFTAILCQSQRDVEKYSDLGGKAKYLGNLKFGASKPLVEESKLSDLTAQIGKRLVVLAASTHPGDEEIICSTHSRLKEKYPDLLTVIAPRHPHRSDQIIQTIKDYSLDVAVRSKGAEIKKTTDIYLANTLGELGLFFTLAKVTIMGGSFKNGGHNPIEPAFFDTHIIFGPDMSNFRDITREFLEGKAAVQVQNVDELVVEAYGLLKTKSSPNAAKVLAKHGKIMGNYLEILSGHIS